MYNSYTSLRETIQKQIESQKSVLNKFPEPISRPITQSCSKYLAQFTSYQLPFKSDNTTITTTTTATSNFNKQLNTPTTDQSTQQAPIDNQPNTINQLNSTQISNNQSYSNQNQSINDANNYEKLNIIQLDTPEQVNWTLENLMYGLTLSHEHQDIIKDCWNVYHDWLSVLLDEPKLFLPQPIRDDPILYSKKMLWHLYHLFVPRKEGQAPTKHIMMCHGVLILIETIAKDSKLLEKDLWEEFLKFFLAINNAVLAPPFTKDDFGEILSSRIVATLFEIWLIACNKVFPSPSLWKTFQELCSNWRHHISLVIEWNRVCYALTNRLLELTWWPESSQLNLTQKNLALNDTNVAYDIQTIIAQMNTETVCQSWFRFLHIIGRPIEFSDVQMIIKSLETARTYRNKYENIDLQQQTSTSSSSISIITQACIKRLPVIYLEFLKGVSRLVDVFLGLNLNQLSTQNSNSKISTSSLAMDQKSRSKSLLSSNLDSSFVFNLRINLYKQNRPSVNSLLDLFGQWLFEAAICMNQQSNSKDFVLGQAESYGILCKIICSVKTNEKINHDYLSRFYALILNGLKIPSNLGDMNQQMEYESGEILASILVNGYNLFKIDLDGINILLVPFLNALNSVFKLKYAQKEEKTENKPKEIIKSTFQIGSSSVSLIELKRYCILILSSLLSLPNHFSSLNVNDLTQLSLSFYQLRSKILEIFLAAMTNEQDTTNLQMLFGCGKLIVGEWTLDETMKNNINDLDKRERAFYCYNQIVSLICVPLKINHATLQNHSFALSIFDSLASIASSDLLNEEESICKLAISWIWHYVRTQIKRRSREHTREMHSVIVAAYNCLIMLLITKPALLKDKNCLQTITNCIEIGISGSSSYPEQKLRDDKQENAPITTMKADKELKPASMRVKEAAECVLCFLMEHTSFSISENSSDLTRLQLEEKSIIELTNKNNQLKWKYYAIDGSIILAVLERPLVKSSISNISPQVTILLRGSFSRNAWSLHFRQSPFNKIENVVDIKYNLNQDQQKPILNYSLNKNTVLSNDSLKSTKTIDEVTSENQRPKCELSIPTLGDVADKCFKNLKKFKKFKQEQIEFENISIQKVNQENSTIKILTSIDQSLNIKNCNDFNSSRMFLSNLGFCSLESSTKIIKDDMAEIVCLDSSDSTFYDQLLNLDNLPTRTFCSGQIFYVKKDQTNCRSILDNINQDTKLDDNFYKFIQTLGSILDVSSQQQNLLANINNNIIKNNQTGIDESKNRKLNKINGIDNVIYWSDITSEIVFSIPNGANIKQDEYSNINQEDQFKAKYQHLPNELKVLIIWLEQIQDADNIPVDDLVQETCDFNNQSNNFSNKPKEIIIIFIHPLENRLNRIITWSNLNKKYFYTMPLIDGMVVSSRMLSSMVRHTVLNIFRRKRLELDDYQPPHVRRKNKISEIIKKYQAKKPEPDLFTSFLIGH